MDLIIKKWICDGFNNHILSSAMVPKRSRLLCR